jgi:hypothetical protein
MKRVNESFTWVRGSKNLATFRDVSRLMLVCLTICAPAEGHAECQLAPLMMRQSHVP